MSVMPRSNPSWKIHSARFLEQICDGKNRHVCCCGPDEVSPDKCKSWNMTNMWNIAWPKPLVSFRSDTKNQNVWYIQTDTVISQNFISNKEIFLWIVWGIFINHTKLIFRIFLYFCSISSFSKLFPKEVRKYLKIKFEKKSKKKFNWQRKFWHPLWYKNWTLASVHDTETWFQLYTTSNKN